MSQTLINIVSACVIQNFIFLEAKMQNSALVFKVPAELPRGFMLVRMTQQMFSRSVTFTLGASVLYICLQCI